MLLLLLLLMMMTMMMDHICFYYLNLACFFVLALHTTGGWGCASLLGFVSAFSDLMPLL